MKKYLLLLSFVVVSESYLFTSSYKQTALKGVSAMLKPLDLLKQGDVPRVDVEKVAKSALSTADKLKTNARINIASEDIRVDLLEEALNSADFNVANHIITRYGARTMLELAIKKNMLSCVRYIVTHYLPDLKNVSQQYWNLIFTRIVNLHAKVSYEIIKCLIDHNINVNKPVMAFGESIPPLFLAVMFFSGNDRLRIVKAMVEKGANVHARDAKGKNVFEYIDVGDLMRASGNPSYHTIEQPARTALMDYLERQRRQTGHVGKEAPLGPLEPFRS